MVRRGWLRRFGKWLIEFLLYPGICCLSCGEETELDENGLCPICKERLDDGFSLYTRHIDAAICHSAFIYDDNHPAGMLVRRLKFGGISECGVVLGDYCAKAFELLGADLDVIVPVPISIQRYRDRGLNQSKVIADKISTELGIPCKNLLKKKRHTRAQSSLNKTQRMTNVLDAYVVSGDVKGLKILLIDDVLTTGATTMECRFTLMRAGASQVHVFCATMTEQTK